ncbi:MAG: CDP-alcohol phosphatidyltransferase family protein [Thermodesulfovibrionales bacterium]|nr:CDP-alcohol phosphatidyltransferase family protein [Thermodesulfovibrionales bacterium]
MFGEKFGHFLDKPLEPLAKKLTIHPNILTLTGFFITIFASSILPFHLKIGGLFILLGALFDMLDGIVARSNGKTTQFGAFLDSVLDRFSDFFIFFSIGTYFAMINHTVGLLLTAASLLGAFMISYIRARAEGLNIHCKVGLMERPERIILISFGCLTGWLFQVMVILFFLIYFTVIQRILHVYKSPQIKSQS